jgi:HPr kinase/phosphorylase
MEALVAVQIHGALVEIEGAGVLLRGRSGVGKSECALELVRRGHRLVADDLVRIEADPARGVPLGSGPELIRHFIEIRGIGLLDVLDLYGEEAVRMRAAIDLVVHLEAWREGAEYERVGLDRGCETVGDFEVASMVLPVRPATSMATLVEAAVRDEMRRKAGVNGARVLDQRLRLRNHRARRPLPEAGP